MAQGEIRACDREQFDTTQLESEAKNPSLYYPKMWERNALGFFEQPLGHLVRMFGLIYPVSG